MKERIGTRSIISILLLSSVLLLTSCSYITSFVVVNASDQSIEVQYKIRSFPGPFIPPETPAVMPTSQLHDEDKRWRTLSASEYTLDPNNRTIAVQVSPNDALLVERVQRPGMQIDDAEEARSFAIEEINIKGSYGEIKLQGKQARKAFVAESKKLYTLAYR